jgi:hypothetical protein
MSSSDIPAFHQHLQRESVPELWEVGKRFEDSIWRGEDFPTHQWEGMETEELNKLTLEGLKRLLKPIMPL